MRVLHVCSEVYPLLKTGGLADVTGALPAALAKLGCEPRLLLPGFPAVLDGLTGLREVVSLAHRFGAQTVRLMLGRLPNGLPAYAIEAPELYQRPGNPYADAYNNAYDDNDRRFALLGWVAADLAVGLDPDWQARIVHGHDWHAGLAAAYLKAWERREGRRAAPSVFTVHNLAYQGLFPAARFAQTGLPADFMQMHGLEYHGQMSYLKAGLYYADRLTTVSPTYAQEIQTAEQGCGLDGLLHTRARELSGVLNGVDYQTWNPATDTLIAANYSVQSLEGKRACRRALQRACGLDQQDEAPIFGVVSRLTEQKGLQLLLSALPWMVERGAQVVLLGSGEAWMEQAFRDAALRYPGAVAVEIGYDEARSHAIVAGADVILLPSRFEPCGLTQMYGLSYGTLPLVRRVGGLADTVVDCNEAAVEQHAGTGFVFGEFTDAAFGAAVDRALRMWQDPGLWHETQRNGMRAHFSWDDAAAHLLPIYRELDGAFAQAAA
jgi:starch synthase